MPNPIRRINQSTDTIAFGDADPGSTSRIVFQIEVPSEYTGSLELFHRVPGTLTWVACPYKNRDTPQTLIASGTAITGPGVYEVDATGVEIELQQTSYTSGEATVVTDKLLG